MKPGNRTLYLLGASAGLLLLALPSAWLADALKSHFSFLDSMSAQAGATVPPRPVPTLSAPRVPRKLVFAAFSIKAPHAKKVAIAADFNNWDSSRLALVKGKDGVWRTEVPLPPGRYLYQVDIDGKLSPNPAGGRTQSTGDKQCSVITVQ